ncbi:MAG: penicillin-binding protein 2 [Nitrospirae bacterium]|uniref:penicillin-binding protein 2 n=1 Tax=Candidatus Magnetobacterium casense TaxID=1455061 RepID=UPI00069741A0|nr:penicillin-binding protein 2 [Candidatus Magnetobacterium casensis]MBF0338264.1 penicillin-binding protein 2 [Nitrospirota bacterium]
MQINREYFIRFTTVVTYAVIGIFTLLTLRLYYMQILKGSDYRDAADSNRVRVVMLPAPRGTIYDRSGVALATNKPYFYASVMPGTKGLNTKALAALLEMDEARLQQRLKKEDKAVFNTLVLKEGLSFQDVQRIEARRSDFPGVIVETSLTRNYVYGSVGSHIIGYLGKPTKAQLQDDYSEDITPDTFVGQWGVEMLYDKKLRGIPGKQIIEVDALGRQLKVLEYIKPEMGSDITLSIDIELQSIAEELFNGRTGALVAIAPNTGEVLALVSLPSFDPNDFVMGIDSDKWALLNKDKQTPLLNRAMQSAYPPGSIFKPLVAIAALQEGVLSPEFDLFCDGALEYGSWSFGCWKRHGHVALHRALVESCDMYFYEAGKRLGIDRIAKYAKGFGLTQRTNLGIAGSLEREGVMPSVAWKKKQLGKPWFLGETFISSIGQGFVSVTPMQAAIMTSMIANNGIKYPISILKEASPPVALSRLDISPEHFAEVKRALYGVVNEPGGTGSATRSSIVGIAGKTGTAQVIKGRVKSEHQKEDFRDHAWFIAFAPYENPTIALAIIVEHGGHGGSAAAPVAKGVIETYIKKNGYTPSL